MQPARGSVPTQAQAGGEAEQLAIGRSGAPMRPWARSSVPTLAGGEAVIGSERLPADAGRVYRDTHRVVLKAKAPFSGEVRTVRLRLHERPAGPDDGSGWDVCAYTAADGAMGESKRWLIERHVRPITIAVSKTGVEQTIEVSPPLSVAQGDYIGIQNRATTFPPGWQPSWGETGKGGMCLSLDDYSDHGEYVWKFEGGMDSEAAPVATVPREEEQERRGCWPCGCFKRRNKQPPLVEVQPPARKLDTTGRLKERRVGFSAILSPPAQTATAAADVIVVATAVVDDTLKVAEQERRTMGTRR